MIGFAAEGDMIATMMDVPLTIDLVVDRAERWNGGVEVVSRRPWPRGPG